MKEDIVIFKGTKEGLYIIFKEQTDFEIIKQELKEKVIAMKSFLSNSKMTVKFNRDFSDKQISELSNIFTQNSEININMIICEDDHKKINNAVQKHNNIESQETYVYKGTLRSGQSIEFDGNVVVVGDVNNGAEILASGDVIVLGSLRGMVHAGITQSEDSFIFSLDLQPIQLRIGNAIGRPDERTMLKNVSPQFARTKDGSIYLEKVNVNK